MDYLFLIVAETLPRNLQTARPLRIASPECCGSDVDNRGWIFCVSCRAGEVPQLGVGGRGKERGWGVGGGLLRSLVFMAQPEIAALKQAIISRPPFCLPHCCAMKFPPQPPSPPPPNLLPPPLLHCIPLSCIFLLPHPSIHPSIPLGLSIPSRPALPGSLSVFFSLVGAIEKIICCCCVLFDGGGRGVVLTSQAWRSYFLPLKKKVSEIFSPQ